MKSYLFFLALLAFNLPAVAINYFVDFNTGNDGNSGLTPAMAFKTLTRLNAVNLQAGDSVFLAKSSVWINDSIYFYNKSGTFANPIVFSNYGSGSKPRIILSNLYDNGVRLVQCDHIQLNSLYIIKSKREGVLISKGHYITISNVRVDSTFSKGGFAFYGGGNNIRLFYDTAIYTRENAIYFDGSISDKMSYVVVENCYVKKTFANDGIVIHNDISGNTVGRNFILRNNHSEQCFEQGFDITSGDSIALIGNTSAINERGGIVTGWNVKNVYISRHRSTDDATIVQNSAFLCNGNARNIVLYYNIFEGNVNRFVDITGNSRQVKLHNNVFAWNGFGTAMVDFGGSADTIEFYNNILTRKNDTLLNSGPTLIRFLNGAVLPDYSGYKLNYNCYLNLTGNKFYRLFDSMSFSFTTLQTTYNHEQNGFYTNPLLVDPPAGDYHPQLNSLLINQGLPLGYASDFSNVPVLANPEIGCLEYNPMTNEENVPQNTEPIRLYPIPAIEKVFISSTCTNGLAFSISDLYGRSIENGVLSEPIGEIDISGYKNGIYLFISVSSDRIYVNKFMVAH
ncbi:MAG: right-handed parallel beta-helix repeat-containing protein [Bacteroidia bacterium]|nr:right-handed parallel beta-helix repeat-containing protein [Bacteroidia bacterium]